MDRESDQDLDSPIFSGQEEEFEIETEGYHDNLSISQAQELSFEKLNTELSNFLQKNCSIKNLLGSKVTEFLRDLKQIIQKNVRGSHASDAKFFQSVKDISSFSSVCGRALSKDELYFRCFDCDLIGGKQISHSCYALQCRQCFEKANHEGHKVVTRLSTGSAVCDCGDVGAWASNGFCSNHKGFSKEKANQMLSQIPKTVEMHYTTAFEELIYLIFRFIEENKNSFQIVQNTLLHGAIQTLRECYHKENDCFKLLTIKLLRSTFNKDKLLFRHDCKDFERITLKEVKHPCTCSVLELLFRFNCYVDVQCQTIIRDLFLDLFVDYDFKRYLTEVYTKMNHFYYLLEAEQSYDLKRADEGDEIPFNLFWKKKMIACTESENVTLSTQLLMTDDLSMIAASGGHLKVFADVLRRILRYSSVKEIIEKITEMVISSSLNLVYIFEQKQSAICALKQLNVNQAIMDTIMDIQKADRTHLNDFIRNFQVEKYPDYHHSKMMITGRIIEVFEDMMSSLFSMQEKDVREKIIMDFGLLFNRNYKEWKKFIKPNSQLDHAKITTHPCLFFSFGVFVSFLMIEAPNLEELRKRIKYVLAFINEEELQDFWSDVLYECLKCLVFFKILPTIPDFIPMKSLEYEFRRPSLYHFYPGYRLSDYEVLLSQLSSLFIQNFARSRNPFEELLSYTTKLKGSEMFQNLLPASLSFSWNNLCFEVFTFIMKDETSYANIIRRHIDNFFMPANQMKPFFEEVVKRMIVNYLHIFPSQKLEEIDYDLKRCIFLKNDYNMLEKIVDFDNQTQKLRLKDSWKKRGLEPQMFFKSFDLDRKMQAGIKEIHLKDKTFNIILGTPEPSQFPLLSFVERSFSVFYLMDYEFFLQIAFLSSESNLKVTGILRFIYMCQKILEQFSYKDLSFIFDEKKLKVLKLSIDKLTQTLSKSKFSEDYLLTMDRIISSSNVIEQKVLNKIESSQTMIEESKIDSKNMNEDPETQKKLREQIQREVKEKFAKKQQTFMTKTLMNPEESVNEDKTLKIETLNPICQYCLHEIDTQAESYGCPVFFSNTNLPDYCQLRKKELRGKKHWKSKDQYDLWENNKQVKASGYLTISSCKHYMHQVCFQISQKKESQANFKMNTPNEFFCNLCKVLCNFFLTLAPTKNDAIRLSSMKECNLNYLFTAIPEDLDQNFMRLESLTEKNNFSEFVDQLLVTNFANIQRIELDEFDEPEDLIKLMVFKYAELIDFLSLQRLNEDKQLLSTCSKLIRNFYWSELNQYMSIFVGKAKKVYHNLFDLITSERKFEDSIIFAQKFIFQSENSTEVMLEIFWSLFMLEKTLKKELSTMFPMLITLGTVIEYLKLFVEEKLYEFPDSILDLTKSISIDSFTKYLFENLDMQLPTVLSFLRKIITMIVAIDHFDLEVDQKCLLKTSEILKLLLSLPQPSDVKHFIKHFLITNSKVIEGMIGGINEYIKSFHLSKQSDLMVTFDDLDENSLPVINFPTNYQEFRSKYQRHKCQLCNEFSLTGRGSVCLICGKVLCRFTCKENGRAYSDVGNLNEHSRKKHCGISAFVDTELSVVFLLNSPKNVIFKHLYEDKYGQRIDPHVNTNWTDYKLNKQIMSEIKKLFVQNSIPQKICRIIDESEKKIKDGSL